MPRRETWTKSPLELTLPLLSCTRVLCRSAVVQMPMIELEELLTASSGTWRINVFKLKPFNVSRPVSLNAVLSAQPLPVGEQPYTRSNTRKSRKNGSSACPASVVEPSFFPKCWMASDSSAA